MPTIKLFPNPYHHIDHKGRLAGIAFELEAVRDGRAVARHRLIGAKLTMVDGSYVPDTVDRNIEGLGVLGHGDVFHLFNDEPVEVVCADEHVGPYQFQAKNGELFIADDVPLEGLAAARLDAIAKFVAAYGKAPDTTTWGFQFPIDEIVANVSESLGAKREAEKRDVESKARASADAAAFSARKLREDRRAALVKRGEQLAASPMPPKTNDSKRDSRKQEG